LNVLPNLELEVLYTDDEASAVDFLQDIIESASPCPILIGLDAEWKAVRRNLRRQNGIALLQLCHGNRVLLWDVASKALPVHLQHVLSGSDLVFCGMSVCTDISRLHAEFGILLDGIDLHGLSMLSNDVGRGLKATARGILHIDYAPSKAITCSNWNMRPLTSAQLQYACMDAYESWALGDYACSVSSQPLPRIEQAKILQMSGALSISGIDAARVEHP